MTKLSDIGLSGCNDGFQPAFMRTPCAALLLSAAAFGQGLWEQRAPMPVAATEVSSAYLNGQIYSVCGLTATGNTAVMYIYNVRRDEWRPGPPLPISGGGDHCNFAAARGRLYLLGAIRIGSSFIDGNTYEYDPQTNAWQMVARMNVPRGASGVAVINDRIYVAGGLAATGSVAAFEVFDPASRTWTVLPNMPSARDHLTAQAVNGRFYAIAGRTSMDLRANEEFDPATSTWRARAPILTARGGLGSGIINGRIVVFGGEGNSGRPESTFVENEEYDPAADSWRRLAPMITGRHGLYGVAADNRLFAISGGPVAGATFSAANEVFYLPPTSAPVIVQNGIVNAASYRPDSLAPGTIASLFGSNLSQGEQAAARLPFPMRLNAVEIRVNGETVPLIYVSPGQINFLLPGTLPVNRSATVAVVNAGAEGSAATINVTQVAPGIFGVLQRGEALEIYITGTAMPSGMPAVVMVGGTSAETLYFGPSGFQGVEQVNVRVPPGVRGPSVPVSVRVGDAVSNTVAIRIE
jgi:hypothetical protein